jgi:hypothetical protein
MICTVSSYLGNASTINRNNAYFGMKEQVKGLYIRCDWFILLFPSTEMDVWKNKGEKC